MNNFIFKNPTKLIFGKGEISKLSSQIPTNSKIMITYGGGSIKKNGVYDQVKQALKQHNIVVEFSGIEPNPHYETLMKAVQEANKNNVDYVLAVGGGSVIDGTKFIVCAMKYSGSDAWDILTKSNVLSSINPVPFAAVLTLPATASEMNNGAVITREATKEKLAFHHEKTFPQFSILDPETCYSLPKRQVANGVADAYCHTLEQYLTYPTQSLIQDRFAESILLTLKEIGPKLINCDKPNYDLMANFMLSATVALNGFISMGVPQDWATHMVGHELTALHGLDHGVTLAIVGPSLINVMRKEKAQKILQYGERVWNITTGTDEEKINATIKATRDFYESLGIKTHLKDYNIGNESFNTIVKRFEERKWMLGENKSIDPKTVLTILEGCL